LPQNRGGSTIRRMDEKTLREELERQRTAPPVTEEQLAELRARLEYHRQNPDEPTFTLDEIRRGLFTR
ncbi:MAG: hypothetical protein ACHQPH_24715, partial [Reyranellales bacterium]